METYVTRDRVWTALFVLNILVGVIAVMIELRTHGYIDETYQFVGGVIGGWSSILIGYQPYSEIRKNIDPNVKSLMVFLSLTITFLIAAWALNAYSLIFVAIFFLLFAYLFKSDRKASLGD